MRRQLRNSVSLLLVALVGLTGCHPTQPFYFHEDGDLSHYLDRATEIEYPDVESAHLAEAEQSRPPLNIADPEFDQFWDLTLEEVMSIALQNSKVIRNVAAVSRFDFADGLLNRTASSPTVYDPAITESLVVGPPQQVDRGDGSLFLSELEARGLQQGVQDALSEFDAQFYSNFNYGKTDRPRNVPNPDNNPLAFSQANIGNYLAALSKKSATGGVYTFRNRTSYNWNNTPIGINRALPSDWTVEYEVEAQYPLLRGRGEQINRIPVVLARINTDITLADFEASVRNLLMDIENTYWDLYLAYRAIETARLGRDSAQVVWRDTAAKTISTESKRGEAQAREQYFFFRAQLETSQHELFEAEGRLRWLMGLAATDGRVIRPKDDPTIAEVQFAWDEIRTEALLRSPELRQQKWRIKQRELELIAAKNWLLPRLDATVLYRWVGVGDNLISANGDKPQFPAQGSFAYQELMSGNYQEAAVGVEFVPPRIGARRSLAAVRNAQLQLARTTAQLEDMELQQVHLLSTGWRNVRFRYGLAISQFDRWNASLEDVKLATGLYEGGREGIYVLLDAQRRRAQSQIDFYRAIADYNKAIAEVHFRKGSLIEFNGIQLAEGPWPHKAYWDALGKARERDASYYLDYGWTRPRVVSRGPVPQGGDQGMILSDEVGEAPSDAELVPTPAPTPSEAPEEEEPLPMPQETEPAPTTPPKKVPAITNRPLGPTRDDPDRAGANSSARRVAVDEQPQVVPVSATEPVNRRSSNPLRQGGTAPRGELR